MLVQATGSVAVLWLPAIAPKVAGELGISASVIGYQIMIAYLGAMLTSLMVGGLISRLGAWRTSQLSLLMFGLGHLGFMTGDLGVMIGSSFVMGFGYGIVNPPSSHILNQIATPKNRNLIFSLRFTGVPVGGIIASLAAPALALDFGWQASLAFPITMGLVLFVLMQPLRAHWDVDRDRTAPVWRNPLTDLALIKADRALLWICLVGLLFASVQLSLTTFTVTFLFEEIGYTLVAAGLALSAVQVAGVAGRIGWGVIADRLNNGLLVLGLIGVISLGCALATYMLTPEWPRLMVYALFGLFGFSAMGWNGVMASEMARLSPPGKTGNVLGAAMFVIFAGVAAGPAAFSVFYQLTGRYGSTFLLMAAVSLAGIAAIIFARRHARGR